MRTIAALTVIAIALGGCSSSKTTHGAASTTTTAPSPCTTAQLDISVGQGNGAAGHIATPIVFKLSSGPQCTLVGYPAVVGLDATGKEIASATNTPRGVTGGLPPGNDTPPVVAVTAHNQVSAILETSDVPQGTAPCATYESLRVTPPGQTQSVPLTVHLTDCSGLQVHPLQEGP